MKKFTLFLLLHFSLQLSCAYHIRLSPNNVSQRHNNSRFHFDIVTRIARNHYPRYSYHTSKQTDQKEKIQRQERKKLPLFLETFENKVMSGLRALGQKLTAWQSVKNNFEHNWERQKEKLQSCDISSKEIARRIDELGGYKYKKYAISKEVSRLFEDAQIDQKYVGSVLEQFYGNELQHAIHQEYVEVYNRLSVLENLHQYFGLQFLTTRMALIGCHQNRAGLVADSCTTLNFCNAAVDFVGALAKGTFQGVDTVANMIVHPIETVKNVGTSFCLMGYCAGKVLHDALRLPYDYCYDQKHFESTRDEYCQNISWLCGSIEDYYTNTTWQEKVADGTAFVVEGILCAKIVKTFGSFSRIAKAKALEYVNNPSKTFVLTTADGVQIAFASNVSETVSELSGKASTIAGRVTEKVHNMKQLAEKYEYWRKIIKYSEPVKNSPARRITQKIKGTIFDKGDVFYIDTLHWDHIEVFAKSGKFSNVLNLDGSINSKKAEAARIAGRYFKP